MITDGTADSSNFRKAESDILASIERAALAAVRIVQIREKRLTARLLSGLVKEAVSICANSKTSVLVNERFDIALAAGADGVHLASSSMTAAWVRDVTPAGFLVGVSVHSIEEAKEAASENADYVMYGPVFDTPSKRQFGKPKGLERLEKVCGEVTGCGVIAVGGIDLNNAKAVLAAGADGFAAIRLFRDGESFKNLAQIYEC